MCIYLYVFIYILYMYICVYIYTCICVYTCIYVHYSICVCNNNNNSNICYQYYNIIYASHTLVNIGLANPSFLHGISSPLLRRCFWWARYQQSHLRLELNETNMVLNLVQASPSQACVPNDPYVFTYKSPSFAQQYHQPH